MFYLKGLVINDKDRQLRRYKKEVASLQKKLAYYDFFEERMRDVDLARLKLRKEARLALLAETIIPQLGGKNANAL